MCGTLSNALKKSKRFISTCFFPKAQIAGDTMERCNELGLAASAFPESVLIVAEDTIGLKMAHDDALYDMFQDSACYG